MNSNARITPETHLQASYVGLFDLFKIGIGPSSSHTVGPMIAARRFIDWARATAAAPGADRLSCELIGSLAATGKGHGSDLAVCMGIKGISPETAGIEDIARARKDSFSGLNIRLGGAEPVAFFPPRDIVFSKKKPLAPHPNALVFSLHAGDATLAERVYFSVGGGFVECGDERNGAADAAAADIPYPFASSAELVALAESTGLAIHEIVLANETALAGPEAVQSHLVRVWSAMNESVTEGLAETGSLPGPTEVRRRAAAIYKKLMAHEDGSERYRGDESDWISCWAIAVNETNASFGKIVTAPTNGAAGVIPAVLLAYHRFFSGAGPESTATFLLTATAFGSLLKRNASISGADVGCQGEVGSAAAMAAAGLTACLGGTPHQIENAAEIALEHHLGMTCDPIGGLVQIPCIERNALAANKAVSAARLAMLGDGMHYVSFDQVTKVMLQTGHDMKRKYRETSKGGLAVNVTLC